MLRFATSEDAEALSQIYAPYVEKTTVSFEYHAPTAEEFAQRILACQKAGDPFLIATHQGQALGYAYAHPYGVREAYGWSVESSIYLRADITRRAVGTKLYRALFALCRLQGYRQAWAVVAQPNDASDAFHRAFGFTDCGVLPHIGYKMGRWLGVRTWRLGLTEDDTAPGPVCPVDELDSGTVEKILRENA